MMCTSKPFTFVQPPYNDSIQFALWVEWEYYAEKALKFEWRNQCFYWKFNADPFIDWVVVVVSWYRTTKSIDILPKAIQIECKLPLSRSSACVSVCSSVSRRVTHWQLNDRWRWLCRYKSQLSLHNKFKLFTSLSRSHSLPAHTFRHLYERQM